MAAAGVAAEVSVPDGLPNILKDPQAFNGISDRMERSRALFTEAGKVIQSHRCLNCHPNGDSPTQGPTQGNATHLHYPPVTRGPHDIGVVGMKCVTCHQDHNLEQARVPGAPNWHLAPKSMAWAGKNLREICEGLKDPKRNGNKTMDQLIEHFAQDPLVGWGWHPGSGRKPAPGTQKQMGDLIGAWIANGAACPKDGG